MKILKENEEGTGLLIENDAGYVQLKHTEKLINEIKEGNHDVDIELYAVLQKYNTPNKNGRIYPESILKRENEKYQILIKKKQALSELNHPTTSIVDLDRVSHIITETWWEGNVLMGKLKLLTSPGWRKSGVVSTRGDQAAMLLKHGVTLGISSRGVGSLKNIKGQNIVQDDFELICFDLVSTPSTPGAYVFQNKEDRQSYEEDVPQAKNTTLDEKSNMKNMMAKLDSFLGR